MLHHSNITPFNNILLNWIQFDPLYWIEWCNHSRLYLLKLCIIFPSNYSTNSLQYQNAKFGINILHNLRWTKIRLWWKLKWSKLNIRCLLNLTQSWISLWISQNCKFHLAGDDTYNIAKFTKNKTYTADEVYLLSFFNGINRRHDQPITFSLITILWYELQSKQLCGILMPDHAYLLQSIQYTFHYQPFVKSVSMAKTFILSWN